MPEDENVDQVDQVDGQEHDDSQEQDQQSQREQTRTAGRGQRNTREVRSGRGQGQQDQGSGADEGSNDRTFTQDDVDKLIADRLKRERAKYGDYDDLKRKAAEFDKAEDAKKTELEKLNDQLTTAQVELQAYRVAEIRRDAASKAGLDPELAEYITSADPDEALAQAKKLAERLKPPEPKTADFRQGSRQPAKQGPTRDDLVRGLAGYHT